MNFNGVIRPGEPGYQRCTVTIMDTTDPEISFDQFGRSNWATDYYSKIRANWNPEGDREKLDAIVRQIKEDGAGKKYNCILGLSGGLDSSYLALLAHRAGLNPLVVHTDTGWNSELAVSNIEKIVKKCDFNLHTRVIDWSEMAALQRSFLRSGVPNQDIPQDHAIFAAFYEAAIKHRIKWVLNGSNYACESILPPAWGYDARDVIHLNAIHRRFGDSPLRAFPRMGHLRFTYFIVLRGLKVCKLLNLVPYHKEKAIKELGAAFGWRYYGGKHYESRWTRYFQGWWLPFKFGFDKRLAHLSSLILAGQLSRDDALAELRHDNYPEHVKELDQEFIIKKLGMREGEFLELLRSPPRSHFEYPTGARITRLLSNSRKYYYNRFRTRRP